MSVAVNVAARQLQQRGFVDTVAGILKETGLEARYLDPSPASDRNERSIFSVRGLKLLR